MRVGIATCAALPEGHADEARLLVPELRGRGAEVDFCVWSDPGVDWGRFDSVVVRSVWDYTRRREEFLSWADSVGSRLQNAPAVLRWNSDKRYMGGLAEAGIPVVPTEFVGPGESQPPLEGEVVVKPTVSAGARDTGRFGPATHADAVGLIDRICAAGRTAMVQPYLAAVDEAGETALVFFAGEESHALRKLAVLEPDREAELRDDEIGAAVAMWDEDLVRAGSASTAHRDLAARVLGFVTERFGAAPLYARVDMLPGDDGEPVLGELEVVEPHLYLGESPKAAARLAEAILRAARCVTEAGIGAAATETALAEQGSRSRPPPHVEARSPRIVRRP